MELSALTAISPIDGRYRSKLRHLANYFSEYALIKYRVFVEVEYFIALAENEIGSLADFPAEKIKDLRAVAAGFSETDAERIKHIEKTINHDVKAVEYFLKEKFDELQLEQYKEFIHFALTSQDINNTAVPLSLKEFVTKEVVPATKNLQERLEQMAKEWHDVPMLARTHGQPASPTVLGKEIQVFIERLDNQLDMLERIPFHCKFGGATGNFNAHHVAFPEVDWKQFANEFTMHKLELVRQQYTTQIEHYDMMAAVFDNVRRINTILIDLCRDVWTYISMDYFKQKINKNEVGSSAMPHKVNPIDFENAEGNLGMANAIFGHLSEKLPISRLQRDLTDSTVTRNIGVPAAHTMLAVQSIEKGLGKLLLNKEKLAQDLEENWAVVAEGIQTILRSIGYPQPYEALKNLTRNNERITEKSVHEFIDTLDVDDEVKARLKAIRPENYIGI